MATFIIYIIRWAVVLTMLYSLYGLLMKRETLHAVNRLVLLAVLTGSMALPLCQMRTSNPGIVTDVRQTMEEGIKAYVGNNASERYWTASLATGDNNATEVGTGYSVRGLMAQYVIPALVLVYIVGVVVAWLKYLLTLCSLVRLIRLGKRISTEHTALGIHVLTHPAVITPCSWMRWVLLNPADANSRAIICHETAHIRLRHSWDMLLCEFTCRWLWFLPFAWMLRQDLRDVHEYQADRCVLTGGVSDEEYQLLLVRKATGRRLQPVVNALNQSPVKRRFSMMCRKPSRRLMALKGIYLLPLAMLAVAAFAEPQVKYRIERQIERSVRFADERLMKADLRSNHNKPSVVSVPDNAPAVLDSVMNAIGARKIGEGTYIGHFQPSLNNDTVRVSEVDFLDLQSKTILTHVFPSNSSDQCAYTITLQAATRADEKGFYIRRMTPVSESEYMYDKPYKRK